MSSGPSRQYRSWQKTAPSNRAMYPSILRPSPRITLRMTWDYKIGDFSTEKELAAGLKHWCNHLHLVSTQVVVRQPFQPRPQLLVRGPLIDGAGHFRIF